MPYNNIILRLWAPMGRGRLPILIAATALLLLTGCQKEETYPGSIYERLKSQPGYEYTLKAMDQSGLAERYQDPKAELVFFAMTNTAWLLVQMPDGQLALRDAAGRLGRLEPTGVVCDNGVALFIDRVVGVD